MSLVFVLFLFVASDTVTRPSVRASDTVTGDSLFVASDTVAGG